MDLSDRWFTYTFYDNKNPVILSGLIKSVFSIFILDFSVLSKIKWVFYNIVLTLNFVIHLLGWQK